jgi:hypothetical protein
MPIQPCNALPVSIQTRSNKLTGAAFFRRRIEAAAVSWQRSLATGTPYHARLRMRGVDRVPTTVELIAFGHPVDDGTELWRFHRKVTAVPFTPVPSLRYTDVAAV